MIRLLVTALALACAAGAEIQLIQVRSTVGTSPAVHPRRDCRTSVEGDECYEKVVWAMKTGIEISPDWYPNLTKSSSFEDFQRFLHGQARLSHVCPEPCRQEQCRTPVEGDACYKVVAWAMKTGVVESPDWFAPLTTNSSFEDFQRHAARLSDACPEPCAARAPDALLPAARLPPPGECRTSVEGDACYEKVVWAMRVGVVANPGWYTPLTKSSSFEDFQRFLHSTARLSDVCPEPCAAPAPRECHTSVEGDECYEKVVWAMRKGVAERPGWYAPLTKNSSFEDFQRFLHGQARLSPVCREPCSAREVLSTPAPSQAIDEQSLLNASYPGYEQTGRNCQCGNALYSFSEEHETLALCAYECDLHADCLSFGLHPAESVWSGACNLYDASCNDTDGHGSSTTCVSPSPQGAVSVLFNKVPTPAGVGAGPAPTPAPTLAPTATPACDVTDGSSPSSSYPCMCGPAACESTEICSTDSCAPPGALTVEWPCPFPGIGGTYFSLSGASASGAPVYSNVDGSYLYWDASCDGSGGLGPRWVVDNEAPNTTASMDLDADGDCVYFGHYSTSSFSGVPLGSSTWTLVCDGNITDATVSVAYNAGPAPTPAPTLEPGVPCACGYSCGGFFYVDVDGDSCISAAEAAAVDGLSDYFAEMDTDGDRCVTQEECANSSHSDLIPSFKVDGAPTCDYGFYVPEGASVCLQCPTGETRRRRSTSCTECPPGKEDLGDFDNCISGAYLLAPFAKGDTTLVVNTDIDEGGILMTRGSTIQVSTRNPGYYQRLTIVDVIADTRNQSARLSTAQRAELGSGTVTFDVSGTPAQYDFFDLYDRVISICSGTSGSAFSSFYPCGCGSTVCQLGEFCDLLREESAPADALLSGSTYGQGGVCLGSGRLPTPAPTVSAQGDPHLVNLQGEHFDVNQVGEFTLLRIPQDTSTPAEMELKATILPENGKPCTTYIMEVEISGTWLGGKVVQVRSYRAKAQGEPGRFLGLRLMSRGAEAPWERLEDWTDMTYLLSEPQSTTGFMVSLAKTQWHSKKGAKGGAPSVAGQVEVRVQRRRYNESAKFVMRQDLPMQEHLNLAVRRVSALGREDVGGLLGFDPHPESLEAVTPECQRHRDGLDGWRGPRARPAWKTRWEKVKEQRGQAHGSDGGTSDNEAAASLLGGRRAMMCVCAAGDHSDGGGGARGRSDGGAVEGVLAEFQTGRLAEATWD